MSQAPQACGPVQSYPPRPNTPPPSSTTTLPTSLTSSRMPSDLPLPPSGPSTPSLPPPPALPGRPSLSENTGETTVSTRWPRKKRQSDRYSPQHPDFRRRRRQGNFGPVRHPSAQSPALEEKRLLAEGRRGAPYRCRNGVHPLHQNRGAHHHH